MRAEHSQAGSSGGGVRGGMIATWTMAAMMGASLLLIAPAASAQSGSLADAARQARAQRQTQPNSANSAQQVADELSEDQNDDAPGGFKTYNAGDYKLWVPAPYKVEGHDDAGVVLGGPMVGVKHPMVLVGTPIAVHWKNNDEAFLETATQFSHLYTQTATCAKSTVAGLGAFECGLAAANLLGQRVGGNAVFVLSAGNIYPVFCVAPTDSRSRDIINNPHVNNGVKEWSRETLQREEADTKSVWQKCDTVFQSIRVRPTVKPDNAQQQAGPAVAAVSGKAPAPSGATGAEAPPTVAVAATGTHQDAAQAVQAAPTPGSAPALSTVPAGFKVHAFNYCKSANQCWNASVLVPADAKLVSSTCKQYIFESKVQGTAFLLMAGPANGECDGSGGPDPVRWNQLVDPESKRAPGTYNTISSQNTNLDGKPAIITTMSFRRGLDSWEGKRVEVENNGVALVAGCLAPRDHFADGEAVCSTLIGSLQLP